MTNTGRTSIGLRNVAIKSTPPHLMVISVLVDVNLQEFSNLGQTRVEMYPQSCLFVPPRPTLEDLPSMCRICCLP